MNKLTGPIAGMAKDIVKNHPQIMAANKAASHSKYGLKAKEGVYITFLTPRQLAAHLQISLKTLERMRTDGSGPPFTKLANKTIRYPIMTLDVWLDTHTSPVPS